MVRLIPANAAQVLYVPASASAWVLSSGGTPATMDVDFINDRAWNAGSLTSIAALLSCSRAGSGFYTKADNTLVSFANDTLRYGTNGLLVEEARTNLCLRSQEFSNAAWTISANAAVAADATAAPDGTTTADSFTSTVTSLASRNAGVTAASYTSGLTYTFSVYVKQIGSANLQILVGTTSFGSNAYANFNLTAGTLGTAGSAVTGHTITSLAGGWYRISFSAPAISSAGSAPAMSLYLESSTSATRGSSATITSGDGVYLWGGQVEQASARSSYIATTSAAVTRPADLVTFADVTWLSDTADSLYAEWKAKNVNNANVWAFDATNDKALDEQTGMSARIAGATTATTAAADAIVKAAWRMVVNDYAISMNGGTVATDTSETAPGTLTASRLGVDLAGANQLNGMIRRVVAFKSLAVVDAALQTLST